MKLSSEDAELLQLIFEGADFRPSDQEERCFVLPDNRTVRVVPIREFHEIAAYCGNDFRDALEAISELLKGLPVAFEYKYDRTVIRLRFSIEDQRA